MTAQKSVWRFIRKEPVLFIAFVCAIVSAFFVHPSAAYFNYIDLRVLCLLFCLMAIVEGLREVGVFTILAQRMLTGKCSMKKITLILILLPFFSSMMVTNDVALITFVPFTILVIDMIKHRELLIPVIVLQTVAANLGSMATPVGNPQNLFLYAHFQLSIGDFLSVLLPLVIISFILLMAAGFFYVGKGSVSVAFSQRATVTSSGQLIIYLVLFVMCLLAVCRILNYIIFTAAVIITLLFVRPRLLRQVDYMLLLTFVFFFIFSGNLGEIPEVHSALSALMARSALLCSAAASQFISNVPAAVLLSGLTQDWKGLLAGVDIGGLGTPIASLASLISLKFYINSIGARPGRYLLWFTLANLAGLVILIPVAIYL